LKVLSFISFSFFLRTNTNGQDLSYYLGACEPVDPQEVETESLGSKKENVSCTDEASFTLHLFISIEPLSFLFFSSSSLLLLFFFFFFFFFFSSFLFFSFFFSLFCAFSLPQYPQATECSHHWLRHWVWPRVSP